MLNANRCFFYLFMCEIHTFVNVMERFIEHFCVKPFRMCMMNCQGLGLNKHFYLDIIIYNMDNGEGSQER